MFVGDIAYGYEELSDGQLDDHRAGTIEEFGHKIDEVKTGQWLAILYTSADGNENQRLELIADGANPDKDLWRYESQAMTDVAMTGVYDYEAIMKLPLEELKRLSEDASSENVFPYGVYVWTGADGDFDIFTYRDPLSQKIVGIRISIME